MPRTNKSHVNGLLCANIITHLCCAFTKVHVYYTYAELHHDDCLRRKTQARLLSFH